MAYIGLAASTRGFSADVSKALRDATGAAEKAGGDAGESFGGGFGAGLAKLGKVAVAGLAAAGVAAAGLAKSVVSGFGDYEQAFGGIETLFGDSADKMQAYAAEAYKTAGVSATAYMENVTSFSASLLQGLGGDTDKAADLADQAMRDMADNANKFGTDISSVQNAYQGFAKGNMTMLDNLKLGYGGTKDEMARLLNDSGVLGDSFVATAKNLDEVSFDKIIAGITVTQDRLGVTGTTALEAASTVAGSIGMMKASWSDLVAGLGNADADMAGLTSNVVESLQCVVGNVMPVVESLAESLPQVLSSLVGEVVGMLPTVLDAGLGIVLGLIDGIVGALPDLVAQAVPVISDFCVSLLNNVDLLVDAGMKVLTALIEGMSAALPDLIPAAVGAILGIVGALIDNLPLLISAGADLLLGLADGLNEAIPHLVEIMPVLIEDLVSTLTAGDMISKIISAGVTLFSSLLDNLILVVQTLVPLLPGLVSALAAALIDNLGLILDAGVTLFLALVDAVPQIIPPLIAALPCVVAALIGGIVGFAPSILEAGNKLLGGLIDGIVFALDKGWAWIRDNVFTPLKDGLGLVGDAFSKVPDIVSTAWDKIKEYAAKPINFVIETVYGHGIKGTFDRIAEAVGLDLRLPEIAPIAFAAGGVLPGWSPGRDIHRFFSPTGGVLDLSGGESIMRPEFTRLVGGAAGVARLNALARAGRLPFAGFADGGVWDSIKGAAAGAWDWVKDKASAVGRFLRDPVAAIGEMISAPVRGLLDGLGGSHLVQMVAQLPLKVIGGLIDRVRGLVSSLVSSLVSPGAIGGDLMGAASWWASQGASLSEHPNFGGVTAGGHMQGSKHYSGRAVDLNFAAGTSNYEMGRFDSLLAAFRAAFPSIGVIWRAPGHFNHMHIEAAGGGVWPGVKWPGVKPLLFDAGGYLPRGTSVVHNGTGRPEPLGRLDKMGFPDGMRLSGTLDLGDGLTGRIEAVALGAIDSLIGTARRRVENGDKYALRI